MVEDVAIVLGDALSKALGHRRGIRRFGSSQIPMDDALVSVAVDLGGRSFSRVELDLNSDRIEGLGMEMIPHFFSSLTGRAGMTLHIYLIAGVDPHHSVEAAFKAFARAARAAWARDMDDSALIPSTKGIL